MLLKDVDQKAKVLFHRAVVDTLGKLFFCTTFDDYAKKYDLHVRADSSKESYTTIANASAEDILCSENWRKDVLLFYTGGSKAGMMVTITLYPDAQVPRCWSR